MISLFGRSLAREAAEFAHGRVVEQARRPIFFTDYGVPDTLDGRFELICLHAFLYLHRLKVERPQANRLCQAFFDRMFADFDRTLREMGTGDLSIGKQVKLMACAFFGRIRAYESGLNGDDLQLGAVLSRNLYGTISNSASFSAIMVRYVRSATKELHRQPAEELLAGRIIFRTPTDVHLSAAVSPPAES